MSRALSAYARPTPCGAHVTPTRSNDWRSALRRMVARAFDGVRASVQGNSRHERLPALDAATLRDLGLNHVSAVRTSREFTSDSWR
jgi:hypothetical protein